jgi:hypothetical protein
LDVATRDLVSLEITVVMGSDELRWGTSGETAEVSPLSVIPLPCGRPWRQISIPESLFRSVRRRT